MPSPAAEPSAPAAVPPAPRAAARAAKAPAVPPAALVARAPAAPIAKPGTPVAKPAAPGTRRPGGSAGPPGRRDSRRPAGRPGAAPRPLPPHLWFAGRLLDVLTGQQPVTALAGRVRNEAYQQLWELHGARTDWRARARGRTPYVCSCRCFRTEGGALEVAAVVALDQGVIRALAFRLEAGGPQSGSGYGPARWHCTAVAAC